MHQSYRGDIEQQRSRNSTGNVTYRHVLDANPTTTTPPPPTHWREVEKQTGVEVLVYTLLHSVYNVVSPANIPKSLSVAGTGVNKRPSSVLMKSFVFDRADTPRKFAPSEQRENPIGI